MDLPVREVRASVGAGFIYPICGEMRTMPGLSTNPAAARIDIDEKGEIVGAVLTARRYGACRCGLILPFRKVKGMAYRLHRVSPESADRRDDRPLKRSRPSAGREIS